MADIRETITRLECCLNNQKTEFARLSCSNRGFNLGGENCVLGLMADVLSLLKAQEPRVMTLDEVEALPYGHVLIETDKNESLRWLDALMFCKNTNFSFDFITMEGRARLLGTEYNREWRCWTSRPSDSERGNTPWTE